LFASQKVHLQCNVVGDTPVDVKWKIQASQQYVDESADARYSIRQQTLDDGMVSELGISHTYRQDSGVYICMASNSFGQDELMIQLVVQEVPESPKNLRINSQQSRNIQISWNVPFSGNSPIEEFIVQYKPISDSWQNAEKLVVIGTEIQATIINLQPAKAYHVRITAENKFGASDFSEVIQVTTLEEVPSGAPTNVKAETRSSTEIYVSWDAPERELWNGNLLGYYVGYQPVSSSKINEVAPTASYSFKTVEVQSHFGGDVVLSGLNKFSAYKIIVQAYTSQGSGPTCKEILVATMEDGKAKSKT
jgi:Down syndrome cell adhesion molecule